MATAEEINAEIARRKRLAEIDKLIAEKQGGALDSLLEPLQAIGGGFLGEIGAGLSGIAELVQTGDINSAVSEINRVRGLASETFAPETESGKQALQFVGDKLTSLEKNIIRPALAGTAGLANLALRPSEGIEGAKQTVRAVREQGLGKAAGQQVLQETGSPLLATLAETSPTAAEFLIPAQAAGRAASGVKAKAGLNVGEAQKAVDAASNIRAGGKVDFSVEDVVNAVQKGTDEDIAIIVNADPKFYNAVDALGINAEPLASYASRNPQFRSISGALEVVPGSTLEPQGFKFIEETAKSADDLIARYGGTKDKAQLGLDFKRESLKTVSDLYDQADEVYGSLKNIVDRTAEFDAPSTVGFLRQLDASDELSPKLKSVLKQLEPKSTTQKGRTAVNPATGKRTAIPGETTTRKAKLGRIDTLRKQFGQAINKGSGAFKDQETGLNKAIYARLTQDLDNISEQIGGDALNLSDSGKALVRQRKQIEDNLQTLLGKDLNQALSVNVSGAVKNLSKGEVDRFQEVINAIPKSQRGEIVLSSMNDTFKGAGVNREAFDATQFTKWYQTINRSPAAKKALFDALPKGSRKAIDDLFEVSRGISRALGQKRPTGVSKIFDSDIGLLRKMLGSGAARTAVGMLGGVKGSLAADAATSFLNQSTDGAKAAASLIASDDFKAVIRQSVKEGVFEGKKASSKLIEAEKRLMKSARYKKWADSLAREDAVQLTGGFLGYMTSNEQEQE